MMKLAKSTDEQVVHIKNHVDANFKKADKFFKDMCTELAK